MGEPKKEMIPTLVATEGCQKRAYGGWQQQYKMIGTKEVYPPYPMDQRTYYFEQNGMPAKPGVLWLADTIPAFCDVWPNTKQESDKSNNMQPMTLMLPGVWQGSCRNCAYQP